ncbi:MAG: sugar phosphate isomerase/epimerase [Ignisphaera sp.]|nr:sugar phosphate isomerase/epimerase [Ignisphaera sp.]MDW8084778.1 sugar phosphate isomerase/epimerase [Ignisphaera sp.]
MVGVNLAWLYAITKYGYPPTMDQVYRVIDDAARLGFSSIELEFVGYENLKEFENHRESLKRYLSERGVRVVNVAAILRDLVSMDSSAREKALAYFRRSCELAVDFGSNLIQTDTFTPPVNFIGASPYSRAIVFGERYRVEIPSSFSWISFWNTLVDTMRRCSRIAREYNLKFAVEPRIGETISNSDAMLRLIDEVNEDNFGAVLDAGHLHAAKELIPLSIEKLGGRILYVHASDNDGRDNFHWAPGRGTIDWDAVFIGLKKHGYRGYIAVDVGGQDVRDRLDEEVTLAKNFIENKIKLYHL